MNRTTTSNPQRILLIGGTGTAGAAAARALVAKGHNVVCVVRPRSAAGRLEGVSTREVDVTDAAALMRDGIAGDRFDAVVSCLASRTGAPRDAWAVDHDAQLNVLQVSQNAGVRHFILLSAICVQKPQLEFQYAKLAFEDALIRSDITYSIVRPTAFFKSLSGQIQRVRNGKPFLLFGDGAMTACKPISDGDLAEFIVGCLDDPGRRDKILPIGGPGPAITPRDQGEALFEMTGMKPRFRRVPLRMFDLIGSGLGLFGGISSKLAAKAELAKIGRYYATESMLVWDPEARKYDAEATPETGNETLFGHYSSVLTGESSASSGAHAIF